MLLVTAAFPLHMLHNPTWGVWLAASGPFPTCLFAHVGIIPMFAARAGELGHSDTQHEDGALISGTRHLVKHPQNSVQGLVTLLSPEFVAQLIEATPRSPDSGVQSGSICGLTKVTQISCCVFGILCIYDIGPGHRTYFWATEIPCCSHGLIYSMEIGPYMQL